MPPSKTGNQHDSVEAVSNVLENASNCEIAVTPKKAEEQQKADENGTLQPENSETANNE